jgi:hypothetical protein
MPANYVLLEKVTVGATTAASISFNNIPQTGYTDLVLKVSARDNTGNVGNFINISLNSSGTGFTNRFLNGNGSTTSSNSAYGQLVIEYSGNSSTANTFGNGEIYFPNYTSANYKSYSADSVSENNATTAYADLTAGLWSNTAAITKITLTPNTGSFTQYSTFSLYGIAALNTTPLIFPKATGGNIIENDGTYWYHAFLATGSFTPAIPLSCDVLVVAGGGGGGRNHGGGGGAGGYRTITGLSVSSATTATIGAGGANSGLGTQGSSSIFSTITSAGGGFGANNVSTGSEPGGDGGSGGGTRATSGAGAGNTPSTSPSQGFSGGIGVGSGTGGGGGAGAVGANAVSTSISGAGGAGLNTLSSWLSVTGLGVSGYVAGGGGGGSTTTAGAGGTGGGGAGGAGAGIAGTSGTANTGGGGGGGGNSNGNGGDGGSGIVIIRYTIA